MSPIKVVSQKPQDLSLALVAAAKDRYLEVVRLFLETGVDKDFDAEGWSQRCSKGR